MEREKNKSSFCCEQVVDPDKGSARKSFSYRGCLSEFWKVVACGKRCYPLSFCLGEKALGEGVVPSALINCLFCGTVESHQIGEGPLD